MNKLNNLLLLAALICLPAAAVAAPESGITVQTEAQMEKTAVENGVTVTRLEPLTTVVPGDEVVFTISFRNNGAEPAENVVIGNPVPPQMRYVDGSATGDGAVVEFSVDGGRTWGAPGALTVRTANGGSRPATAADYTGIRWRLTAPLAAGAEGQVRYRAIVK